MNIHSQYKLINQLWAGLGYYRRAKSLHNCAKEIVAKHQGKVPETADLLCELPGIGQYTAGAIASIAFGEATPLVDGNVVRVLARLRAISDDTKAKETIAKFWALATELLSHSRPGDFNQSLMELGATVCTKQPKCAECPIQDQCLAYKEATAMHQNGASADVEDLFKNTYPAKPKKKEKKELRTFVSVIEFTNAKNKFLLLRQRPSTGLLASLWEFPSLDIDSNFDVAEFDYDKFQTSVDANMKKLGIDMTTTTVVSRSFVGTATHLFTHIRQTLWVESIKLVDVATTNDAPTQFVNDKSVWCVSDEVNNLAISNGSLKCFSLAVNGVTKKTKLRAPPTSNSEPTPKKRKLANLKGQSKLSFGKATD